MKAILLIDFGSTYTKVTAVDVEGECLLGTAASYTTVQTDINDGLEKALAILRQQTGQITYDKCYACSSAAGGLRMVTSGLVPELTGEAAKLASLMIWRIFWHPSRISSCWWAVPTVETLSAF